MKNLHYLIMSVFLVTFKKKKRTCVIPGLIVEV
jgi:hypothetical protein